MYYRPEEAAKQYSVSETKTKKHRWCNAVHQLVTQGRYFRGVGRKKKKKVTNHVQHITRQTTFPVVKTHTSCWQ